MAAIGPPQHTLRVVAKKARVALQTASKSLNGDPSVRSYLRERVLQAAKELGYQLDPMARAMATGSSHLVTLSVFELANPFFGSLVDQLTRELTRIGMTSVFCEQTDQVVSFNTGFRAAGSILISPTANDVNRVAERRPLVTILTQNYAGQTAPDVTLDIESAYTELTRRVLASGRRRVAFHCHPAGADIGFKVPMVSRILQQAGLSSVALSTEAMLSPAALAQHLVRHPDCIDTIFCINDLAATGALTELMAVGVRVPQDVLLIGCDGAIKLPTVWTAVADVRGLAVESVACLQRQLHGERERNQRILTMSLHTPSGAQA